MKEDLSMEKELMLILKIIITTAKLFNQIIIYESVFDQKPIKLTKIWEKALRNYLNN